MIIVASLPLFSLLACQIFVLFSGAWVSSWVFLRGFWFFVLFIWGFFFPFSSFPQDCTVPHPGVWVSVYLQNIRSMAPTSEPAGKKMHSCISITLFQTTGREKADGMEPPSTKKPMPGLFWTWKMHVRHWPRALHCTGRIVSVVRQLDSCSRTQFTIVKFFWSRWMLLFNRDQSLRAWWQVVAHFYFSLRCESHLNCLSHTRHRVNFSW